MFKLYLVYGYLILFLHHFTAAETTTTIPDNTGCIPNEIIENALNDADTTDLYAKFLGESLRDAGFVLPLEQPGGKFFRSENLTLSARNRFDESDRLVLAAQIIVQKTLLHESNSDIITRENFINWLNDQSECPIENIDNYCTPLSQPQCANDIRVRSLSGTCNNLKNLRQGARLTSFTRLLPAYYSDDIYAIRKSVSGNDLPSARYIRTSVFSLTNETENLNMDEFSKAFNQSVPTVASIFFEQSIIHDFTKHVAKQIGTESGPAINCCSDDRSQVLVSDLLHPACAPIKIPSDDPFFSELNITCHNYIRSQTMQRNECSLSAGDQVNILTSYIDASFIYGSDGQQSASLRLFEGGRFIMDEFDILPVDESGNYVAGDARVTKTTQLAFFHSILYREHNRIADELSRLNSSWNDQTLFNQARRIVIALLQRTVYEEWLPAFFGKNFTINHNLTCPNPPCEVYDENIDGSALNDFSTNVKLFSQIYIPYYMDMVLDNGTIVTNPYRTFFGDMSILQKSYDDIARGLITQPIVNATPYELLSTILPGDREPGIDILSMNIQRGRDHGLAPYCEYRDFCGFGKAHTFEDLAPLISEENIEKLRNIYESVHDIDLIVGVTAETVRGYLTPTTKCLFAEQFKRFMVGDRFFYTNTRNLINEFTQDQLNTISESTFSRIICDNTNLERVPRNSFLTLSPNNEEVLCSSLPKLNLQFWQI